MKNFLLPLAILVSYVSFSQSGVCGTDAVLNNAIASDPQVAKRLARFEDDLLGARRDFGRYSNSNLPDGTFTIPVVVYIVHDGTMAVNISDARVNNQLSVLNTYFSGTGLQFCLATKVNGTTALPTTNAAHVQTTPGIIHINNAGLSNHASSSPAPLMATAAPLITKERYLRIWVVKSIDGPNSGILGYSMFPNTSAIFDGIVMKYNAFGNNDTNMIANYHLGKVLAHEVGHYLALHHTFEGSCSNHFGDCLQDGDRVCDTPPVATPNFGCISGTDSCTEASNLPDDLSNYMDYGDNNCQDHFTPGQIDRMLTTLNMSRSTLISTDNLIFTGTCGSSSLLSATITASDHSPCSGTSQPVAFSCPAASTYSWNFGDPLATASNPNTATTQSASHVYTSAEHSPYTVTLTVTASNGTTRTSSEMIFVSDCAPISGSNSYWYVDASNGLDFSSGRPVFDPTFPTTNFANLTTTSQCDADGNLLFYTNKFKVWNNQHTQINSTDLMLNSSTGSRSQVLALPKPPTTGSPVSEYYIFTKQVSVTAVTADLGFYYSMVNVSGTTATMGAIGVPISLPASYGYSVNQNTGSLLGGSGLTAVKKCGSDEYWLLTTLKKADAEYITVFTLSAAGLVFNSELPIVSAGNNMGWHIEMAPNGNKILLWHQLNSIVPSHIYDFNKAEGIVSSNFTTIALPQTASSFGQMFGGSFSPDSNLLYVNDFHYKKIYQYNINTVGIDNSRKQVASPLVSGPWDMELGPDNKLYVSMANNSNNYKKFAVIHTPNNIETTQALNSCNFSINGPTPAGFSYRVGPSMPNLIDARQETAYFEPNTQNAISRYITGCNTYKFFPNVCGTSFSWTFTNSDTGNSYTTSETNPIYAFVENGTYVVTLKDVEDVVVGTFPPMIITTALTPQINGSSTACTTQANLSVTNNSTPLQEFESVMWTITGGAGTITSLANQQSVNVSWQTLPGILTLTKTDAAGCTGVSTKTITALCPNLGIEESAKPPFTITPNPSRGLFTLSAILNSEKVTIEVFDIQGRVVFSESDVSLIDDKTIDLTSCQAGLYIIQIKSGLKAYIRKLIKS